MEKYFGLAKTLGLSYPLGRAIQLVSRHWNDGLYGMYSEDAAARMTQTKPSTAKRWLKHWIRGGSVRALSANVADDLRDRRHNYLMNKPRLDPKLLKTLRDAGFKRSGSGNPVTYERGDYRDGMHFRVQLWRDGEYRVSHSVKGHGDTVPSYFKDWIGAIVAITFEETRDAAGIAKDDTRHF